MSLTAQIYGAGAAYSVLLILSALVPPGRQYFFLLSLGVTALNMACFVAAFFIPRLRELRALLTMLWIMLLVTGIGGLASNWP